MPVENAERKVSESTISGSCRHVIVVLGDQLWAGNPAFDGCDPTEDIVVMAEAVDESRVVWSHKARTVLFLSAMRHFRDELRAAGWRVDYTSLADEGPAGLVERLMAACARHKPQSIRVCEPGEYRLEQGIVEACRAASIPLRLCDDTHFMCSRAEFAKWASRLKSLRMEFFYRDMRKRHQVLMQADGEPEGGQWNYDADNRQGYPKTGPGDVAPPAFFQPDELTTAVMADVERLLPDNPGSLQHFAWPVTRAQALEALHRFIEHRLPNFGPWQDAMWTDHPFGWHALLASSLNLHLLDPREVFAAAEKAYRDRQLPLASVEGFIRQILGWREFIRGVYWTDMPALKSDNFYGHQKSLPKWFWTGETHMACMKQAIGQTLEHGYAHHIQRLMVTGNFALLAQLSPQEVSDWYLAVYVDAVEWVELPNVAGMALFANGGRFTSKPYIASGAYIKRMSNYCAGCRYDPAQKTGDKSCPMTTLYWSFLDRHEAVLSKNPRTALMAKNITRLDKDARSALQQQALTTLERLDEL